MNNFEENNFISGKVALEKEKNKKKHYKRSSFGYYSTQKIQAGIPSS